MALTVNNWSDVADGLADNYQKKYFTRQRFIRDNFLACVTPYHETFFGTKVHTVLILANPHTDDWDDILPDLQDSLDRIQKAFKVWPHYKVDIYLDFVPALSAIDEDSDGQPLANMEDFEEWITDTCEAMKDYGFEYKGRIEESVEATYFYDTYDAFYAADPVR